jgi:N-acylneuraminate cytidylyltransferase
MKPLVVIPARGGSKGIPRKNVKLLNGQPLIHYTIEAAREVFTDDEICVSTDDLEIKTISERIGLNVPFIRPAELATDEASTNDVLLHAIKFYRERGYNADVLIILQPTSPFRKAHHIIEALQLYTPSLEMVVSVKETKANPYYVLREEDENGYLVKSKELNVTRRQDLPKVWELNGAIYIINIDALETKTISQLSKVKKYVMDENSSHDIDTMTDWTLAECLLSNE